MSMTTSGWQLRRIAGPDVEPVTLAQARLQCKLDADLTAEDELIRDIYIPAAREAAELYCKQTWVESTWLLTLCGFPDCDDNRIVLPMGPVIDVVRVSYVDQQGTAQQITDYQGSLDAVPAFILPPFNQGWPTARGVSSAVQIEYRAGYASGGSPTDASRVPAGVKHAMLFLIGFWFENREVVNIGNITSQLPYGWEDALFPYRVIA
jgi:uncharacterized phiE125 gp8 family phage protein